MSIKKKRRPLTVLFACAYLGFVVAAAFLFAVPLYLVAVYYGLTILTFILYARDKSAAQRGAWRISEKTLHLFALLGGWPGALLGQKLLRHKSQKQPFKAVLWITIIINSALFLYWLTPAAPLFLKTLRHYLGV